MTTGVDFFSRYSDHQLIPDGQGGVRQETWNPYVLPVIEGTQYIVPSAFRNRLDLIANETLGSPLLWWIIAWASDIHDPLNIPTGTALLIPDETTVATMRGILGG